MGQRRLHDYGMMLPEINATCMFLATDDILDVLQPTYSKATDMAQVYEVKLKTMTVKQENRAVIRVRQPIEILIART